MALYEQQQRIGWENAELGILSKQFRVIQQQYLNQRDTKTQTQITNATIKWMQTLQSELWEYIWSLWDHRNKIVQGTDQQNKLEIKRKELQQTVQNIFKSKPHLLAEDTHPMRTEHEIIKRSNGSIKNGLEVLD